MRVEARYCGPRAGGEAIRALAGPGANCLAYGVTNHYLDTTGGGFARAEMGSPRLRLRLYEAGPFRFGQLEHKRQVSESRTEKRVWRAEQVWQALVAAMPWLAGVSLAPPPANHQLAVLVTSCADTPPDFGPLAYVCALRYQRLSCAAPGVRVTADFDFEPPVIPPSEMIVETKGDRLPDEAVLEALGLKPLALSKFALLSGVSV